MPPLQSHHEQTRLLEYGRWLHPRGFKILSNEVHISTRIDILDRQSDQTILEVAVSPISRSFAILFHGRYLTRKVDKSSFVLQRQILGAADEKLGIAPQLLLHVAVADGLHEQHLAVKYDAESYESRVAGNSGV